MDEAPLPTTPPVSGVQPKQNAPTEIVTEIPDELKGAGGLTQFPVASVIESFRRDSSTIRGDGNLLMLRSLVQGVEQTAYLEHSEHQVTRAKLEQTQQDLAKLSVENAVLKAEVIHKESDKNSRAAFIAIGGIGLGVTVPFVITAATAANILCAVAFGAVLVGGMIFPEKGGLKK